MNSLVEHTVDKYGMFYGGEKVIVALSGGADSVALLDTLNSMKEKYNLTIYLAHINHGLRGEEADRDENFCRELSKKYSTEIFVKKADIKSLAKEQKISEELCGRNVRYSFFEELADKLDAKVATAHTASDNAETLLFNIARGTSIAGVSGIPPKRGRIIRPLIEVTRTQIEQYCSEHNLDYVTDSTNLTDDYTRNNIRHNVIPLFEQINPRFKESAMRLSENAREITNFLNKQTEKAIDESKTEYGYDCKILLKNDIAIQKNAVVMLCKKHTGQVFEHKHIELILEIIKNGGAVNLSDNRKAVAKQGILRYVTVNDKNYFEEIALNDETSFEYCGKIYRISTNYSKKENKNLVVRTRRSGDTFTYFKRNITKPLRKVFNEQKIPSEIRDNLLVVAKDSIILWCEEIGYSAQGLEYNSENELKIEIIMRNGEQKCIRI